MLVFAGCVAGECCRGGGGVWWGCAASGVAVFSVVMVKVADRLEAGGGPCCGGGECCVGGLVGVDDSGSDCCSPRDVVRPVVRQRVDWEKIHDMVVTVHGWHQGRGEHTSGRGHEH